MTELISPFFGQSSMVATAADAVVAWLLLNGVLLFDGINALILGFAEVCELLLMRHHHF